MEMAFLQEITQQSPENMISMLKHEEPGIKNIAIYKTIWNLLPHWVPGYEKSIEVICNAMSKGSINIENYSFHQQPFKYAYYYLCFTVNAYAVEKCWQHFHSVCPMLYSGYIEPNEDELKLLCIGSGAGYGIIGLNEWLKSINKHDKIRPYIVDECDWYYEMSMLLRTIYADKFDLNRDCYFERFFVCDLNMMDYVREAQWKIKEKLSSGAIISIVNISRAFTQFIDQDGAPKILKEIKNLLQFSRPTLLFFMDVDIGSLELIDKHVCSKLNMTLISKVSELNVEIPTNEKIDMQNHHFKSVMPSICTRVCTGLWMTQHDPFRTCIF